MCVCVYVCFHAFSHFVIGFLDLFLYLRYTYMYKRTQHAQNMYHQRKKLKLSECTPVTYELFVEWKKKKADQKLQAIKDKAKKQGKCMQKRFMIFCFCFCFCFCFFFCSDYYHHYYYLFCFLGLLIPVLGLFLLFLFYLLLAYLCYALFVMHCLFVVHVFSRYYAAHASHTQTAKMSGMDLFRLDPKLFVDDDNADGDLEVL